MHFDPHTKTFIHQGAMWRASECLSGEHNAIDRIAACLTSLGFVSDTPAQRHWRRGSQHVVVCLVDDIRSCSHDYESDVPYLWDRNTTVITDNYISCPTMYQVIVLPPSFFGIYSHTPADVEWRPDRDFSFTANRIDDRRTKLILELAKRTYLDRGYVNFNCQQNHVSSADEIHAHELANNFATHWSYIDPIMQQGYQSSYNTLAPLMPIRNYDIPFDQVYTKSLLNITVESYGSDASAAFSEKIFRVMSLPVPWSLYGGRYAVAYLESLGFDCLTDVMDHTHYDALKENEDKVHLFIWKSLNTISQFKTQELDHLRQRCGQAANTNRALLAQYRESWPSDFAQWLNTLSQRLA